MRRVVQTVSEAACVLLFAAAAFGQSSSVDRVSIPFSDPARPGLVKVKLPQGGISVRGYDGKEVVVEARRRGGKGGEPETKHTDDSKRREVAGFTAEEEDNVITISPGLRWNREGLELKVPYTTSLKLSCIDDGAIRVENVEGEIEANCLNGSVTLTRISGIALAHSLNGDVQVRMAKVNPGKPMSFSTLNGDVDVTLPADTRAQVKAETQNGLIHNDFGDEPGQGKPQADRPGWQVGRRLTSRLNGGGAEIQLKTINGSIHLRKNK